MKRVYVTDDDFNNWYANGAPDHDFMGCPWSLISQIGPGCYEYNGLEWQYVVTRMPDYETFERASEAMAPAVEAMSPERRADVLSVFNYAFENMYHTDSRIQDWSETQYKLGAAHDVINYIAMFRWFGGRKNVQVITNVFTNGFCYFFALLLKDVFARGDLVELDGFSHVLWQDTDGKVYDINGLWTRDCTVSKEFDADKYRHKKFCNIRFVDERPIEDCS